MKTQTQLRCLFAAVAAGVLNVLTASATLDLPAPMPEFMDDAQLETWRNDQIAESNAREAAAAVAQSYTPGVFFTGKPLMEETGEYAFLYRNYNPELARWSSEDPSGFPDGANNLAYMAVPTFQFDWLGLEAKSLAWVYWSPANFGGPTGNTVGALLNNIATATEYMNDKDNEENSTSNYLSDGDIFSACPYVVNTVAAINNLFDTYKKLVLFAHGYYVEFEGYTWGGETTFYGTNVFGSNADNIYYATCYNSFSPNPVNGSTGVDIVGNLTGSAQRVTKNYLYE